MDGEEAQGQKKKKARGEWMYMRDACEEIMWNFLLFFEPSTPGGYPQDTREGRGCVGLGLDLFQYFFFLIVLVSSYPFILLFCSFPFFTLFICFKSNYGYNSHSLKFALLSV